MIRMTDDDEHDGRGDDDAGDDAGGMIRYDQTLCMLADVLLRG